LFKITVCQLFFISNADALSLAAGQIWPSRVVASLPKTREVDDNQKQNQRNYWWVSGVLAKLKGNYLGPWSKQTDILYV